MHASEPHEPDRPDGLPLDPTPEAVRELIDAARDRVIDFVRSLPGQPAWSIEKAADAHAWVDEPAPETPGALDDLLETVFERIVPCALNTAGPGYLAYVPGGGLVSAAVADLIAGVVNRYAGVWAAAPGAVELETRALRWLAEIMGLPRDALGVLTSGGSMSSLLAVIAARDGARKKRISGTWYLSSETHHCIFKALRVAGIDPNAVRTVPVDERYRIRLDLLEKQIRADQWRGLRPAFICGNAGTVNTGAVDPLDALADIAARHSAWFHVDGAYGALFRLVEACLDTLSGIERADSIALDPHKGLFLPYGLGALLVRSTAALREAFSSHASYMPALQDGVEHVDFCELSPELSRDWRGLRLWLPLKLHGIRAFRDALAERRALAVHMHDTLASEPDVEIAAPPELSLFAFRRRFGGCPLEEANARNRALLERINEPRRVYLTGTDIDGVFWIRVCVLHLRTDRARVDEALEIIRRALRE